MHSFKERSGRASGPGGQAAFAFAHAPCPHVCFVAGFSAFGDSASTHPASEQAAFAFAHAPCPDVCFVAGFSAFGDSTSTHPALIRIICLSRCARLGKPHLSHGPPKNPATSAIEARRAAGSLPMDTIRPSGRVRVVCGVAGPSKPCRAPG